MRIISHSAYNAHTEPLFKKQEILRFEDLYTFSQLEFFHAYVYEKLPTSFDQNWVLKRFHNPSAASLRNSDEFFVPNPRLHFSGRLPLHSLHKLWNNFEDSKLKNTFSAKVFKEGRKKYFLNDLASHVQYKNAFCQDSFPVPAE